MCKSDPDKLILGYTRTMMGFLLSQPKPERIAMMPQLPPSLAVCQKLNPVDAHQRQQRIVLLFEVGFPELALDGRELAPQDFDNKVAAPACRFQEAGVDALRLILDEIEHGIDQPRGSEYLSVVSNALSRLDQTHGQKASDYNRKYYGIVCNDHGKSSPWVMKQRFAMIVSVTRLHMD